MRFDKRTVSRHLIAAAIVWFVPAAGLGVGGRQAFAQAAEPFTRDALLMRFDRNRNGKLDDEEKRALREAFGGLDVPLLPAKTHDYTTVTLPATVRRSRLDELDNTPPDNRLTDHRSRRNPRASAVLRPAALAEQYGRLRLLPSPEDGVCRSPAVQRGIRRRADPPKRDGSG